MNIMTKIISVAAVMLLSACGGDALVGTCFCITDHNASTDGRLTITLVEGSATTAGCSDAAGNSTTIINGLGSISPIVTTYTISGNKLTVNVPAIGSTPASTYVYSNKIEG